MINFLKFSRRTNVQRLLTRVLPLAACIVLLNACGTTLTKDTTAASLMPNLTDYNIENTTNIQDAVAKFASAASLAAGQLQITAAVTTASGILTCYQNAGAIEGRTYVNKAEPLKAGLVVIINKNMVTDPNTLISCITGPKRAAATNAIQPCTKFYTLDKTTNQFYIAYVATNPEVCAAFCSALDSCTP